jgi:hypothetical protein
VIGQCELLWNHVSGCIKVDVMQQADEICFERFEGMNLALLPRFLSGCDCPDADVGSDVDHNVSWSNERP